MLSELVIENFALIAGLTLELGPGLNVFTGETGAGKSILLDAVGLLLGGRASAEYIREGAERATITGLFYCQDDEAVAEALDEMGLSFEEDGGLLLSREISRSGRNVCRINGRPVSLSLYQNLGQLLVHLHGQHAYQAILRPAYQLDLLDNFAGLLPNRAFLAENFKRWRELEGELFNLQNQEREREQKLDLLKYQLKEIDAAGFRPGEEEELLQEKSILANAEKLRSAAEAAYQLLFGGSRPGNSAYDNLSQAVAAVASIADLDAGFKGDLETLQNTLYQIEEMAQKMRRYLENLEFNPLRLQEVEERLELLRRLKRKYGGSIEAILKYREEAAAALAGLENCALRKQELEKEAAAAAAAYREQAANLSKLRREAAKKLEESLAAVLHDLEMPAAEIIVQVEEGKPGPHGTDKVEFLFRPNPGEPPQPLAAIASGGEMARVTLALKSIFAEVDKVETLIFDEVDAGIGGRAARAVARYLAEISKKRQVICVTHGAQLAGLADKHFYVQKIVRGGRTFTEVEILSGDKRKRELARLLAGSESEVALKHAAEILSQAKMLK
ncbi:MAG: repair protein RecN [Clostridia bacterium]|nr:repair protein RecN [Clostridia bacterium]